MKAMAMPEETRNGGRMLPARPLLPHHRSLPLTVFSRPSPQPRSLKGLDYKGSSSEMSMLVRSSSTTQINMDINEPKLEDLPGGNSFSNHAQKLPAGCNSMTGANGSPAYYMFSNSFLQLPAALTTLSASDGRGGDIMAIDGRTGNGRGGSIGLLMIKTIGLLMPSSA